MRIYAERVPGALRCAVESGAAVCCASPTNRPTDCLHLGCVRAPCQRMGRLPRRVPCSAPSSPSDSAPRRCMRRRKCLRKAIIALLCMQTGELGQYACDGAVGAGPWREEPRSRRPRAGEGLDQIPQSTGGPFHVPSRAGLFGELVSSMSQSWVQYESTTLHHSQCSLYLHCPKETSPLGGEVAGRSLSRYKNSAYIVVSLELFERWLDYRCRHF